MTVHNVYKHIDHQSSDRQFLESVSAIVNSKSGILMSENEMDKLWYNVFQKISAEDRSQWLESLEKEEAGSNTFLMTLEATLNNETFIFRHKEQFETLERIILPEVWRNQRADRHLKVRMLSAGCSTGAEAFSMVMCAMRFVALKLKYDDRALIRQYNALNDHATAMRTLDGLADIMRSILIDGFDISPTNIKRCQQGAFTMMWGQFLRSMFAGYDSYVDVVDYIDDAHAESEVTISFRVHQLLRDLAVFTQLNLRDLNVQQQTYDVIFCRNVLMYNDIETRERIVEQLFSVMSERGYLVFAPTDFPPSFVTDEMDAVGHQIYQKRS